MRGHFRITLAILSFVIVYPNKVISGDLFDNNTKGEDLDNGWLEDYTGVEIPGNTGEIGQFWKSLIDDNTNGEDTETETENDEYDPYDSKESSRDSDLKNKTEGNFDSSDIDSSKKKTSCGSNETSSERTEKDSNSNEISSDSKEMESSSNETSSDSNETSSNSTEMDSKSNETSSDSNETSSDSKETSSDSNEMDSQSNETSSDSNETSDSDETSPDSKENDSKSNETSSDSKETDFDSSKTDSDRGETSNGGKGILINGRLSGVLSRNITRDHAENLLSLIFGNSCVKNAFSFICLIFCLSFPFLIDNNI